ncbi:unnamed protein product, partial [marine sediment metagenome]
TQYANEILAVWEKKYPELNTLREKYIADLEALDEQAAADKIKLVEDTQAQVLETTQDYMGQRRDLTLTEVEFIARTEEEASEEIQGIHIERTAILLRAEKWFQDLWAASSEEHHEDEIEKERTFWDDFVDVVKDSAADISKEMRSMWDKLKSMAKNALGDTLNNLFDHFIDSRRLANEHADRMLEIENDYNRDAADLQDSRQDNFEDAELTYQRRVEDIETTYRRALQGITSDDTEERARIEKRYR